MRSKFENWLEAIMSQTYQGLYAEFEQTEAKKKSISFEDFWKVYDKKVGTEICRRKWAALTCAEQHKIMEHAPKYVKVTPDKQFRLHPATYLNQKIYNDEEAITSRIRGRKQAQTAQGNVDEWKGLLD